MVEAAKSKYIEITAGERLFRLDLDGKQLSGDCKEVSLTKQQWNLLLFFTHHSGDMLEKMF